MAVPRRVLVVASPAAAEEAVAALRFAPGEVELAGVVLTAPGRPPGAAPLLGLADELPQLLQRHRPEHVFVWLATSQAREALALRQTLEEHSVAFSFHAPIAESLQRPEAPGGVRAPAAALQRRPSSADLAALLGRAPRPLDLSLARPLIEGARVLITGAGGSIGSELARLCAGLAPAEIILMERAENALFEIDRQLSAAHAELPRRAILHDVAEEAATRRIFLRVRPDVVFHAAAHKHVPLMEDHPVQAVRNNVLGAVASAQSAIDAGARRFVFISTDKAVHPRSVMGATKRLAELAVRRLHERSRAAGGRTLLRMVRFGNVLGSNCSVLPIWEKQIAEGGHITVTDPRMTRYFMTIPEAAALVTQAAALDEEEAQGADLFVLDMGRPVRILDLAMRFLRQQGLTPRLEGPCQALGTAAPAQKHSRSIAVRIVGARPGEKLHEELAYGAEELRPTRAQGVLAWKGRIENPRQVDRMLAECRQLVDRDDAADTLLQLRRWFPSLQEPVVHPISQPQQAGAA